MQNIALLQKLVSMEQSIGTADNGTLRQLVYEAEDCVLKIQKERAAEFYRAYWRGENPGLHLLDQLSRGR